MTTPGVIMSRRTHRATRLVTAVLVSVLTVAACEDDSPSSPAPGATRPPNSADVRAPNGTNMGAPPLNAGTAP